jgi:hypothetical protein
MKKKEFAAGVLACYLVIWTLATLGWVAPPGFGSYGAAQFEKGMGTKMIGELLVR